MPIATKREEAEYALPDDTYFPGKVIEVEAVKVEYYKKDPVTKLKTNQKDSFWKWEWKFEITDGEYKGEIAKGSTPAEYTTREDNKVRLWGEVLLGRELEVGEEFDTDSILEVPCMFSVKHMEPAPKKNGDGFWYNCEVDDVMPRSGGLTEDPPF